MSFYSMLERAQARLNKGLCLCILCPHRRTACMGMSDYETAEARYETTVAGPLACSPYDALPMSTRAALRSCAQRSR